MKVEKLVLGGVYALKRVFASSTGEDSANFRSTHAHVFMQLHTRTLSHSICVHSHLPPYPHTQALQDAFRELQPLLACDLEQFTREFLTQAELAMDFDVCMYVCMCVCVCVCVCGGSVR